uniref:Putative endodeoxyribonuclease n=1 Tax=viral metagenome TaxID=1070528 RepID=A0A6H2A4W8_9ZZZZ
MRETKVTIPLINNLSVNHYLIKTSHGFFKRKEVKEWQEQLGWLVKQYHLEDWKMPLHITCNLQQNDNRTRDLSNFSKVCCDALEEVTGINDSNFRWHDGTITKGEPSQLMLVIKEAI